MEEHLFCGKCNEVGKYNGQEVIENGERYTGS